MGGILRYASLLMCVLFLQGCLQKKNTVKLKELSGGFLMKEWSLGRLDFQLPDTFNLNTRNQSTSNVDISANPLLDTPISILWEKRLQTIKNEKLAQGYTEESIKVFDISPNLSVVIYPKSPRSIMDVIETITVVGQHFLEVKYYGAKNKHENMKRLVELIIQGYEAGAANGFNVGEGAIVSKPSRYEEATASFYDKASNCKLTINEVAIIKESNTNYVQDHAYGVSLFKKEGVFIKAKENKQYQVANLVGHSSVISVKAIIEEQLEAQANNVEHIYKWFYAGEKANSLKPQISVKMICLEESTQKSSLIWSDLLTSLKIRE